MKLPRRRILWIGGVLAGLALAATAALWGSSRYVAHSRGYCADCHGEAARGLGGHAETECQRCHEPPGAGVSSLWAVFADRYTMPQHGASIDACESCHREGGGAGAAFAATEGHARHQAAAGCASCHQAAIHGQSAEVDRCASCHEDVPLTDARMQDQCTACHLFARGAGRGFRPRARPGGRRVGPDLTHGDLDCSGCHDPHATDPDAVITRAADCARCHEEAARSAELAPERHRDCNTCHAVHAPRDETSFSCASCHVQAQPSADSRPKTHAGVCSTCHRPHSFQLPEGGCGNGACHPDQQAKLAALSPGSHESCTGCHDQHGPPPRGTICVTCHDDRERTQGAPAAHRQCLSCHTDPHEGWPDSSACDSCHGPERRAVARSVPGHQDCTACHRPHGSPLAHTIAACGGCHQQNSRSLSRAVTGHPHKDCASCHAQHRFSPDRAEARCATCHAEQASSDDGHTRDGPCQSCHQPHTVPATADLVCTRCHHDQPPAGTEGRPAQHARCGGCHRPHSPASRAAGACVNCHRDKERVAAAWRGRGPHVGRCTQCHTHHRESVTTPCATCHADKATRAHRGVHERCAGCHAPHRPPPARTGSWWGRCGDCHTSQARRARAAAVAPHRDCATCHDQPGREPRPCISCHAGQRGVLMHSKPAHVRAPCTACHSDHGTAPPSRDVCEACHEDRRDHRPERPRCQTCHPFASRR